MYKLQDKITSTDILYILNNPWDITEGEWVLNDESIKNTSLIYIEEKLTRSATDGYSYVWKTQDDQPIAILGAYKVEEKKFETFFIASKHMVDFALKLSFEMRQMLKEKAHIYKGYSLGLYSESNHPKQLTWFRFLGFKYIPEADAGNTRYFEYESRVQ